MTAGDFRVGMRVKIVRAYQDRLVGQLGSVIRLWHNGNIGVQLDQPLGYTTKDIPDFKPKCYECFAPTSLVRFSELPEDWLAYDQEGDV